MDCRESDLNLLGELNAVHLKTSELLKVIKAALKVRKEAAVAGK